MRRKFLMSLLVTTMIGGALLSVTADAATEVDRGKTDTVIGFGDGGNTVNPGPYDDRLALVYNPNAFNFGSSNDVTGIKGSKTYFASAPVKQYLVVSDDRKETGGNWHLTASLDEMVSTKDKTKKLENAELSFDVAKLQAYDMGADFKASKYPTESNVLSSLTDEKAKMYTLAKTVTVVAGETNGEKEVLSFTNPTPTNLVKQAVAVEVNSPRLKVLSHADVEKQLFQGNVNWVLSDDVK